MDSTASFGYWLRRRRKALDLTQEALARQVGCAVVTIRKIEADESRPSRQMAERLAECLAIPTEERTAFIKVARAELAVDRLVPPVRAPIGLPPAALPAVPGPTLLKGYELREQIGSGGFGVVYRAYQPLVGREVAVKVILPQYADHPDFIRRFEAEAQLVARLEHPHIVPLYDYWREPGHAYLVMRYLRGDSVRAQLQAGPWTLAQSMQLLDQIAAALVFAHRHSVVHRDLKPANILLDEAGNAYLADFGIAKDVGVPAAGAESPGAIVGSPMYLSPEQIRDEPISPQTDIYSLGLLLYELLAGAHPFADLPPAEILAKQVHEPLPPLHPRRPDLPQQLNAVIERATAKRPTDRYPDVLGLVTDFRRAAALPAGMLPTRRHELPTAVARGAVVQEAEVSKGLQEAGAANEGTLSASALFVANPYKGLQAFGEADTSDFFGREALTQQLLARMAEETDLAHFLAVVGPSGSGKSSVMRAGLLPALRRGGLPGSDRWFIVELVPGAHPLEELEAALLRVAVNPPPSLLEQLQQDERGLLRAVKRVLPADAETELVLAIDQFEEIFTLVADEAARAQLLDSLLIAATEPRSRLRVICTLRADFIAHALCYGRFGELLRQRIEFVLPLTPDELEAAIGGPAARVGVTLEPGLVATIVRDVGDQPGALPLLQYALTELFERRAGQTLTLAAYQERGGVVSALARRADELYSGLNEAGQAAARQLFLRLITLGEGMEDTRRRVRRSELESVVRRRWSVATDGNQPATDNGQRPTDEVIDLYGRYRLLTFDRDPITHEPTVEVAHEALIRTWRRLRAWLDASREDLQVQRRLALAALEWANAGQEASFLARGARLAQFEALTASSDLMLNAEETAYIHASIAERDRQELAERERQVHELELARQSATAQRSAAKRLRYLVGALALFLVVAIGLSAFAFNRQAAAVTNLTRSEAQRLAAEANTLLPAGGNAEVIALLSIRSLRTQYTTQGDAALAAATALEYPRLIFAGHTDLINDVAFSPDGSYVLTGSNDKTARLWNAQTGQQIRIFAGHTGEVSAVAFSPDGSYVLTGSNDKTARLWNAQTGQQIHTFIGHTGEVSAVAFSPDGNYALTGSFDTTARLWDAQTSQAIRTFAGHTDLVVSVAFSPDSKYVLTGSNDKTARLWDAQTNQAIRTFLGHVDRVTGVAFSPDSKYVLTGSVDKTARLWDLQTGQLLRRFIGHKEFLHKVAFSPDGRYVLTGSDDNTARLWDTQTGDEVRRFSGHTNWVSGVAFSLDGKSVLTGSWDKTARLWDVQTSAGLPQFIGHTDNLQGVVFSPDSNYILTGSFDNTARLWDAHTGAQVRVFRGHAAGVHDVAFSPDGKSVLTSSFDKTARLWDVQTGQQLRQFIGHTARVLGVAYSPDRRYVVTSGSDPDKTARLWDAQTGTQLRVFNGHTDAIHSVAYSPDGKYILTNSFDKTARLWDVQTGQQLQIFSGHTDGLLTAAFSPDGKYVLTGGVDKTARLWDAQTGQQLRQFIGHTDAVHDVAFSPDGKYVLTASADRTTRLWDAQTGQELRRFTGHTGVVHSVAYSPDGRYIATGGGDRTARLWDADYHDTIRSLCARLLRDFSDDERAQYGIPDKEPTCPKP